MKRVNIDAVTTREGYDRWLEIYDQEQDALITLEERNIAHLLGEVRGFSDIGCGTGRHTVAFASIPSAKSRATTAAPWVTKRTVLRRFALAFALLAACDKASPPSPVVAAPMASAVMPAVTPPAASAAPAAPATIAGHDVLVEIGDPEGDAKKSVNAKVGDIVTVVLPDYPGTTWQVTAVDKSLGYPTEDTVPSFLGPSTPGHKFIWSTGSLTPLHLKGDHVITLTNIPLAGDAKGPKTKVVLTLHLQ